MMKKLLLLFLFISNSFAGDVVRNGAGLAEQNVLFALHSLEKSITFCLQDRDCTDIDSKGVLPLILKEASLYKDKEDILVFASERENPGMFDIDGNERVAFTGSNVGDLIYINTDLIVKSELTIGQAIQILVHEFGHHHGIVENHEYLDLVGLGVRAVFEREYDRATYLPGQYSIAIINTFHKKMGYNGDILIENGDELISLYNMFKDKGECDQSGEMRDTWLSSNRQFHNISWKMKGQLAEIDNLIFSGVMTLICQHVDSGYYYRHYSFNVSIPVLNSGYSDEPLVIYNDIFLSDLGFIFEQRI